MDVDVGENGRPRGPHMFVCFSINHPIIGVPNFDPYPYVIYERERDIHCFYIDDILSMNGYMDEHMLKSHFEAPFSLILLIDQRIVAETCSTLFFAGSVHIAMTDPCITG